MTTKTPDQIARDICEDHAVPLAGRRRDEIEMLIQRAIEADRAQRDIYELIAEALNERAEGWAEEMPADAASRIREKREDDYLWDEFIGPMLDRMTDVLGM